MVLFRFFCWGKSSKNHLRSASGKGSGRPRQRKVRPAAAAFDLQPRTKSLDAVATRVITGTSHWTVLLFLHCWLASAGGLGCGRAVALRYQMTFSVVCAEAMASKEAALVLDCGDEAQQVQE